MGGVRLGEELLNKLGNPAGRPASIRLLAVPPATHSPLSSLSGKSTICAALVHESELARNEPDSQVHHLPRAYDDGLPSSAIRLRM